MRGGTSAHTRDQQQRIRAVFEAVGIKGELARTSRRHLRDTPEYAEARRRGCALRWLNAESSSMAEAMYELLTTRDLEPPG